MSLGRFLVVGLFALLASMFWADRANATCTALGCSCGVSVGTMSFGTYDPQDLSPHDGVGTVTVTCTALLLGGEVAYEIDIDQGSSGSFSPRTLENGGDTVDYNLFADSGRTQIWGDGGGGTVTVSDGYSFLLGLVIIRNYTLYGRIPASQIVPSGSYDDTLTVTVTF